VRVKTTKEENLMSDLFVRKATGLVRSWSVFDAFVYAFFRLNLIPWGFTASSQMYYLRGRLDPGTDHQRAVHCL